jgi:hypothetical protein
VHDNRLDRGKRVLRAEIARLGISGSRHSHLDLTLYDAATHLHYTGVTRGKRLVILLRQKKAVAIAVKNISGQRRWSKLGEWLSPI